MLKLTNLIKYGLLSFFGILLIAACEDQLGDDMLPEIENEDLIESQGQYFTQPGSPIIIDIFDSNVSFSSDFTVTIDETTKLGTLEMMENSLLKYTPDVDAGTDFFVYTASSVENNATDTDTITIDIGDPVDSVCYPQAYYDCFFYDFSQEIANWHLDVLFNDELCGGEIIEFSVYEDPSYGSVQVVDEDSARFMYYTVGTGFEGYDEFIYKVVLQYDADDDSVSFRNSDEPVTIYGIVNLFDIGGDTIDLDTCLWAADDFVSLPPPAGDSANVESILIDVLANDDLCDGGFPIVSIVTPPEFGYAEVRNEADQNQIEYFPTDATVAIQSDYLEYMVCTDNDQCATAWVIVDYNQNGGECTSLAIDDQLWFAMDSVNTDTLSVSVDVILNDFTCDSLDYTVSIVNEPSHGTYVLSNTVFVYEPDPNYWEGADPATATDQATYSLCDSENNCSEALILIGCE
jgi:hypothetical protein